MAQTENNLESGWFKTNSYTIHARYSGPANRTGASAAERQTPALVMVHGVGVSSRNLLPTAQKLADYYNVFAPDLPGFGLSSKPSRVLNVQELADALLGWMDAAALEQPVLFGNSFGCQVAADLASRYPSRVSSLILVGPTVDAHARNLPLQYWRWRLNKSLELPSQDYSAALDYQDCGVYRFVRTFILSLNDHLEDKLPGISQPVLLLRGEQDKIVTQKWIEELLGLLPDGQLVTIPQAAHTVNYSHPTTLASVIRNFVDSKIAGKEKTKNKLALVNAAAARDVTPAVASYPSLDQVKEKVSPAQTDTDNQATEQRIRAETKGKAYQPLLKAAKYVAGFDSASAMLRTIGAHLHNKEAALVSGGPLLEPAAMLLNKLPARVREGLYSYSGSSSALPVDQIQRVNAEEISRWVVGHYPKRRYGAIMIGSSNGAVAHLCAALGIPWLPQTVLVPVKYGPEVNGTIHPDEPKQDLEWAREPGRKLLEANPDLQLHHMQDQNQDRLMIKGMSYFRVKRLKLGEVYEQFLVENLESGGTIYVLEDQTRWPTTRVDERHYFQHGAVGGLQPQDYLQGSQAVSDFLRRYKSYRQNWDSPQPDGEMPEAEWGFEKALANDISTFAARYNFKIRHVSYPKAEAFSPLVADLYRWWYKELGYQDSRAVIETFMLLDTNLTLKSRSVPFWTVFNIQSSIKAAQEYLSKVPPFEEIFMTLFSHGVESAGVASIEDGEAILEHATQTGQFLGVNTKAYPRDFGTMVRYHTDMQRKLKPKTSLPPSLNLSQLENFLAKQGSLYDVKWE